MSKSEKTRQFIVEQTATIFNKKGFAGTSLTDLTEATGLTKGSIYGNFLNKDEVALAAFDFNYAKIKRGIKAAADTEANAIRKLLSITEYHRRQLKNTIVNGGCPILNTAIDADDTHPELKEKAAGSIRAWKKFIEGIIKQGITKKEVKAEVNPGEFACHFIALIEGGIMLAKVTGDAGMLHTAVKRIEKIIDTELKP